MQPASNASMRILAQYACWCQFPKTLRSATKLTAARSKNAEITRRQMILPPCFFLLSIIVALGNVEQVFHVGFHIIQFFHFFPNPFVRGVSPALSGKKFLVFFSQRFDGRQLFPAEAVKILLRRLTDQYIRLMLGTKLFTVICLSILHMDLPFSNHY